MATNKIAISKIISSSNRKTERWRLAAVLLGIAIVGAGCAQKAVPEGEMQMEVQQEQQVGEWNPGDEQMQPVEAEESQLQAEVVEIEGEESQEQAEAVEAEDARTPTEADEGHDRNEADEQKLQEEEAKRQQKLEQLEALKAAFTDMEAVTVYTTANVNVRMAPSTEAEVWQLVKRGTIFEKNGESEGWSRVIADGEQYYIKSEYLREKRQPGEGGHIIAIDAGHQSRGNSEKEPNGPGSAQMKAKVTGGTRGVATGIYEYELTLQVSEKLRNELENRGYTVYMVRESHDVNISNSERAQMAYDSGAEIFIRIHANGSEDSSVHGAMTICPTSQNPYVSHLYSDSQRLSALVLDGMVASSGCRRQRVWETDTMSGINWSQIPVTIVEMGYMSNPEEDQRMATEEYQQQIAAGIADGVDQYFLD